MRSFRLEHSPLGLLNSVWGPHSASALVLEGRWVELVFRSQELLKSARHCVSWVLLLEVFHKQTPCQPQVKSQNCLHRLAWAGHLRPRWVMCLWTFEHLHFQRSVPWMSGTKCAGQCGPSAHGSACSEASTTAMCRSLSLCRQGWGGVDRQINVNLCGSLVVQSLNNQIPSVHSTNWIAYDKITAFSPTLFNLHFEKNWKWHGKVRPININNCSLFASTVLQHAVW